MSISFGEKVKLIKEAENLSRPAFCKIVDVPVSSMRHVEAGVSPSVEVAEKICKAFPQYTLWLMTGETDHGVGQVGLDINIK